MANVSVVCLEADELVVEGDSTFGSITAGGRPLLSEGISLSPRSVYTIPANLAQNSTVIFQPPVVLNTTCFLPPGSAVPIGFCVRVLNMDAGTAATVKVCAVGSDTIVFQQPNPAYGVVSTSFDVDATVNSNFRWLGTFWFIYY